MAAQRCEACGKKINAGPGNEASTASEAARATERDVGAGGGYVDEM